MEVPEIGNAVYAIVSNNHFGIKVVSGIVTGVHFTEDKPIYDISFGNDRYQSSEIFFSTDGLIAAFRLLPLEAVEKSHNLQIKYSK